MYNTDIRKGNTNNGGYGRDLSSPQFEQTIRHLYSPPLPKVFVVCDKSDTAPVWGYILSQQGLVVILETSVEKASDSWCRELPDIVVIDINIEHQDLLTLCKKFRAGSAAPLLLFLPAYDEKLILEAYAEGVDEVMVKPISPAIFLAKVMSWSRPRNRAPLDEVNSVNTSRYQLNVTRRCLIDPGGHEIKLTNLEFRLLNLLMSRVGRAFSAEDIIRSMWGRYGTDDQILLTNIVYRVRKKIETDPSHPRHLQRLQGGYSFQP